ncbi:hypothetical protein PanWU01x14_361930, partial [Parasponia andersonii]
YCLHFWVHNTLVKRGEIVFALLTGPHPLDHCCQISEGFNPQATAATRKWRSIPVCHLAFMSERRPFILAP